MPELPEVEVSARIAARALRNTYVSKVWLKPCKLFRLPKVMDDQKPLDQVWFSNVEDLEALLEGARSIEPYSLRYGKLMACLFQAQDGRVISLFARLGMTGKYITGSADEVPRSGLKLSLELSDDLDHSQPLRRLDFINIRMFGSVWAQVSKDSVSDSQVNHRLQEIFDSEVKRSQMGPDAYTLSQNPQSWIKYLRTRANHRRAKSALLDQTLLAGVGNIYAVEGLFAAGLHPLKSFSVASDQQLSQMAAGIEKAMKETLVRSSGKNEVVYGSGQGKKSPFSVYGRDGLPCLKCQTILVLIKVAGRSTVFCPKCQPS